MKMGKKAKDHARENNSPKLISMVKEALANETLLAQLPQDDMVKMVQRYCGTELNNNLIPLVGPSYSMDVTIALSVGYDIDESILKLLEYNSKDDAFIDEEEPIETS